MSLQSPAAAAQSVAPGAVQERARETQEFYEFQKRLQERAARENVPAEAPVVDETGTAPGAPASARQTAIDITRVDTNASSILSDAEIRELTSTLEGRRATIQDVFDVIAGINALYKQKGFLARATLPPQKVRDGVVTLKLIEARIGGITVENNASTEDSYILDRLAMESGGLVNLGQLEDSLRRFNLLNDVALRVKLKAGEEFATTDHVFTAFEPPEFEAVVFMDNAGTDDIGRLRLGTALTKRSLLGYRDHLGVGGNISEEGADDGTRSRYVSYSFPLFSSDARLAFSYSHSNVVVVGGPLEVLNVRGRSTVRSMEFSYPLVADQAIIVHGLAGGAAKDSATEFSGFQVLTTDVRSWFAGATVDLRGEGSVVNMRHVITSGVKRWGSGMSFSKYNGDLAWTRALADDRFLLVRARLQLSDRELLPSQEQFQLGGVASVRGYPEGLLIGDHGYFVSAELSFPLSQLQPRLPVSERLTGVQASVFLDHGLAVPYKGNDEGVNRDDFLTSAGFGLTMNWTPWLTARASLGVPLQSRKDGEDDPTVHFVVQASLF